MIFMISLLGCSWLPCLPVCVPEMLSGVYAGVICLPSFVSLHADSQNLPSSFVSLHVSPCVLITEIAAAPSLPSSFVSLHLSPCMLISKISLLHLSLCMLIPKITASSSVSLPLSPCMLIPKITASSVVSLHLSPCMLIPKISLLHLSPFTCLPAC